MDSSEACRDRGHVILKSAAIMGWTAGLAAICLAVVLALGYAMAAESHIPAVICAVFLLAPLALTLVCGAYSWGTVLAEKIRLLQKDSAASWWDTRQRHRILYQAYYL
jgi:hypothetical protein